MISGLPNFIPVNFSPFLSIKKQSGCLKSPVCVCVNPQQLLASQAHSFPLYFHTTTCPSANLYNTNPKGIKLWYVC
jgi:hypothetical protein